MWPRWEVYIRVKICFQSCKYGSVTELGMWLDHEVRAYWFREGFCFIPSFVEQIQAVESQHRSPHTPWKSTICSQTQLFSGAGSDPTSYLHHKWLHKQFTKSQIDKIPWIFVLSSSDYFKISMTLLYGVLPKQCLADTSSCCLFGTWESIKLVG